MYDGRKSAGIIEDEDEASYPPTSFFIIKPVVNCSIMLPPVKVVKIILELVGSVDGGFFICVRVN